MAETFAIYRRKLGYFSYIISHILRLIHIQNIDE